MQVIGICRFSYPAIGGFQVEHDTTEQRMAYLYDPVRMASRFATFEAFTLPCLRAQTDPDFTFLVVTGDDMPVPFRHRLEALVSDIPQITIQAHPPGPHRQVMRTAINSVRQFGNDPCLQFRLDDDDAVGVSFVRDLRTLATRANPLLEGHQSIALDFNQGHIAQPGPDGITAAPVQIPFWSSGLALMLAPKARQTVMNFSHHRVWRLMPTATSTGQDMMLRGFTDFNDSRQKASARAFELTLLDKQQEEHFRQTYNIDADHVRSLF